MKNENTIVTSFVTREQVQAAEIDELMDKRFGGSLPAFLAAFTKSQRLTERELDELQRMIDESRKQANHD